MKSHARAADRSDMRTHIQIVGIVHVVYNLLAVLAALTFIGVWFVASGAIGAGAAASGETSPGEGAAIGSFLAVFGLLIGCASLVPALPGFLGGVGLLRHHSWARLVLIIVSAIHVLTFVPTSVVLGAYSLWVLLTPETKAIIDGYDWIPKDTAPKPQLDV
jgi:hypothetical protein